MRLSDIEHPLPSGLKCPWCDHPHDLASGLDDDDGPEIGAYSICINCGSIATFGIGFVLQRCPDSVWQAEPEPIPSQMREARRAIREIHSRPRDGG